MHGKLKVVSFVITEPSAVSEPHRHFMELSLFNTHADPAGWCLRCVCSLMGRPVAGSSVTHPTAPHQGWAWVIPSSLSPELALSLYRNREAQVLACFWRNVYRYKNSPDTQSHYKTSSSLATTLLIGQIWECQEHGLSEPLWNVGSAHFNKSRRGHMLHQKLESGLETLTDFYSSMNWV